MKRFPLVCALFLFVAGASAQQAPTAASAEPAPAAKADSTASSRPVTVLTPAAEIDGPDPLLDLPSLPDAKKLSLIGGAVRSVDRIRNRMELDIPGGKRMRVRFDDRTKFFRAGQPVTPQAIRKGDRVYVDTQLVDRRIFAKNVNIAGEFQPADAQGQLKEFDSEKNRFVLVDHLSEMPVSFAVNDTTVYKSREGTANRSGLRPGALVQVKFAPDRNRRGIAREVTILAAPGSTFTFFGRVSHVDLKAGVLAIENIADQKTYEITFDPDRNEASKQLGVGAEATVIARFDATGYQAEKIDITKPAADEEEDQEDEGDKEKKEKKDEGGRDQR